jgi:signal transduction histidine kinase
MKLARKLTIALILGIFAVMAVYAWVEIRNEVVFFEGDVHRPAPRGTVLVKLLHDLWKTEGPDRTVQLIDEIADAMAEVHVRWVRPDVSPGDPLGPHLGAEDLAALRAGEIRQVVIRNEDGHLERNTYIPLADTEPSVLEIAEDLKAATSFIRMSRAGILLSTVLTALISGLIALVLGFRFVGKPVRQLRDKARRMGAGDFSGRLEVKQKDEIGELAEEMNALCDRLTEASHRVTAETEARIEALEQLRHADRLATVGQLGAGVAHELGTPLNVISMRAKMIAAEDATRPEVVESARIIDEQSERITGIVRQLLDFSRRGEVSLSEVDPNHVVAEAFDLLSAVAEQKGVSLRVTPCTQPLAAQLDENRLLQALTNVMMNGIHATPPSGCLTVSVALRFARPPVEHGGQPGEYVCITVEDTGTGIRPEDLPRIFEPFFTTKDQGEGTGLGLAVAHGIVAEHGGWIAVESALGSGTTFRIFLPPAGGSQLVRAAS